MQSQAISPDLEASSDRAYHYAYGIDEAYKHLHKTLVEPHYPAIVFRAGAAELRVGGQLLSGDNEVGRRPRGLTRDKLHGDRRHLLA